MIDGPVIRVVREVANVEYRITNDLDWDGEPERRTLRVEIC